MADGRRDEGPDAPAVERPVPAAVDPAKTTGDLALLHELLTENHARFTEARRIERERRIVFPETSVILRDCLRLMDRIAVAEGRTTPTPAAPTAPLEPTEGEGDEDALARELFE